MPGRPFLVDADGRHPTSWLRSVDVEQSLLGALLIRNDIYDTAAEIVQPADFAVPVHGRIFATIGAMAARGQLADAAALHAHFDRDDALSHHGGAGYLAKLVGAAVSFVGVPDYARTIAELARRRDIIMACEDAIADASVADVTRPPAAILEEFDRRLIELSGASSGGGDPVTIVAAVDEAIAAAERVYQANGRLLGVPTGLRDLDRRLGGLHPSDFIVVAGRPGMGKTALATTIAEWAAQDGRRVMLFELEMAARELAARQLAGRTGISSEQQRAGPLSGDQMNELIAAREHFRSLPLIVDDAPMASVAQIRARARRQMRRTGLDLVIVDYLQLLLPSDTPGRRSSTENRVQEVSTITRSLKLLAKELRVPVVALSQLSRAVEQREDKRPVLSDLRESGSIEQDADVVMFLYREEEYLRRDEPTENRYRSPDQFQHAMNVWQSRLADARNVAEILVRKNRHGASRTVKVRFDGERSVFENLAWGEA